MEVELFYQTRYSKPVPHDKGSPVSVFLIKDATAHIDDVAGDVYYQWKDIPIAPIGRYRGIFNIKSKRDGSEAELPNAYKNGLPRTLVIDIGRYR
jgi:hypothetical protein